jgi:hypothetical protein
MPLCLPKIATESSASPIRRLSHEASQRPLPNGHVMTLDWGFSLCNRKHTSLCFISLRRSCWWSMHCISGARASRLHHVATCWGTEVLVSTRSSCLPKVAKRLLLCAKELLPAPNGVGAPQTILTQSTWRPRRRYADRSHVIPQLSDNSLAAPWSWQSHSRRSRKSSQAPHTHPPIRHGDILRYVRRDWNFFKGISFSMGTFSTGTD